MTKEPEESGEKEQYDDSQYRDGHYGPSRGGH